MKKSMFYAVKMKRPNNNYINDELQLTFSNLALYIKLGIVPGL